MATIELGRFSDIDAEILIGRLQSAGIGAFPGPSSPIPYSGGWTSVLIDDSDLEAARRIATENLSED